MIKRSFSGGIHPDYNKNSTRYLNIEDFPAPEKIFLPLSQHIGAPAIPLVAVGEQVFLGQKIAEGDGDISSAIHASVSGTVEDIRPILHPTGAMVTAIIIKNDGADKKAPSGKRGVKLEKITPDKIVKIVKEAGIVGMGGAMFPTHVKLSPGKDLDYVIVNGAECEPYLTSDHRVMLEMPEQVILGAKAIMRAVGAVKVFIAVEDNKKDAITVLKLAAKNEENIEIVPLHTKYPQGAEKQLIKAVTGREVPPRKLPMHVGVVVQNIDTCCAIAHAIEKGMPLISRIVTISGGAIKKPRNYRVRLGTMVSEIIEEAGGYSEAPAKLVLGGPMMGIALHSAEVPITKGVGAVLAFTKNEIEIGRETPCLRCGKCVDACPMRLQPIMLMKYSKAENLEMCKKFNVEDCMECGACTYICPARQHPVQYIRLAKVKIKEEEKR